MTLRFQRFGDKPGTSMFSLRGRMRLPQALMGVAIVGALAFGGGRGGFATAQGSAMPAASQDRVIAEGIFDLGDDSLVWTMATIEAGTEPASVGDDGAPGFLLGGAGAVVVRGKNGFRADLGAGEALAIRPEAEMTVEAVGADPVRLSRLSLEPSEKEESDKAAPEEADRDREILGGESFESPGGRREVDLIGEVLAEGEISEIEAGEAPTLLVVAGGSVTIEVDEKETQELRKGDAALLDGKLVVTGTAAGSASLAAVVIGDEVQADAEAGSGTPGANPDADHPTASPRPSSSPSPTPSASPTPDGNGVGDDPDRDGVHNLYELFLGTDPLNPDTDSDGLKDGEEFFTYDTDPLREDTEGEGLRDLDEVRTYGTDPRDVDTDDDGLSDFDDVHYGASPLAADTDGDGVGDGDEVSQYGSNPSDADTDDDVLLDGEEVNYGTNPRAADTDGDGLTDHSEMVSFGTDPLYHDTDLDDLSDGAEVFTYGTPPLDNDVDLDGLTDGVEISIGTSPYNPDTDGDGWNDSSEWNGGTDPLDPGSHPQSDS